MHKLNQQMAKSAFTNTFIIPVLLILIACAQPVLALEFECAAGTDKRFIRMELPGKEHLCEVSVTYASQERSVKWYANNDSMFCSDKTMELQEKYENEWNFQCDQWPDHDGVDRLSKRQRIILDTELKSLIADGQNDPTPFLVEGLKAAASPTTSVENDAVLLAVQFFLTVPETGFARDVTHIIRDDGVSWRTLAKIESLSQHIDADEGYVIDSALISSVTSNGALKIITAFDSLKSSNNEAVDFGSSGCYGNQVLATSDNGELVARTPHRYYCPNTVDADAG